MIDLSERCTQTSLLRLEKKSMETLRLTQPGRLLINLESAALPYRTPSESSLADAKSEVPRT